MHWWDWTDDDTIQLQLYGLTFDGKIHEKIPGKKYFKINAI